MQQKMRVDARAESSCWDSVSITISIISVINAGLMAAGAAVCKEADDGVSSTMTVLNLHAMFTPIFVCHILAAVLTFLSSLANIILVAFALVARHQWVAQLGFWLAVVIFLVDLTIPLAILLGELSWNGVNNLSSLNIFEMYSRNNSKQLTDLKIIYGVEVVLGFSIFLLGNIAGVFYWIMKMSQTKEEEDEEGGKGKMVDASGAHLGATPEEKVEGQAFD